MNLNIPQAVRLLFEVETFITTHKFYTRNVCKDWVMDFQLARIYTLRGVCMLESGDVSEARKQLFQCACGLRRRLLKFATERGVI
ncbi:Adenylate cyclase type 10, partial [Operophtera brumata]